MAKYWIKNRGRVQGPLSKERIQGLMRRGRFSRHFFVSTDRKEWLPAEDFPELFGSRRSSRQDEDDFDDDTPFNSGGSPFDDDEEDLDERPSRRSGGRKPSRKPVAVFDDEDDDQDDDDWDDDDEDDWDEESDGLIGWIENNVKLIGGILVVGLLVAGWFVLFRESFTQDLEDLETLQKVHAQITTAHATGAAANQWMTLQNEVEGQLASMVSRLEKTAGATDSVKQELLFAARDDLPRMFRELPDGIQEAAQRAQRRFAVVDNMIRNEVRYKDLTAGSVTPTPPPTSNGGPPGMGPGGDEADSDSPAPSASENGGDSTTDQPAPISQPSGQ